MSSFVQSRGELWYATEEVEDQHEASSQTRREGRPPSTAASGIEPGRGGASSVERFSIATSNDVQRYNIATERDVEYAPGATPTPTRAGVVTFNLMSSQTSPQAGPRVVHQPVERIPASTAGDLSYSYNYENIRAPPPAAAPAPPSASMSAPPVGNARPPGTAPGLQNYVVSVDSGSPDGRARSRSEVVHSQPQLGGATTTGAAVATGTTVAAPVARSGAATTTNRTSAASGSSAPSRAAPSVVGENQIGLRVTKITGFDSKQGVILGHAKFRLVVNAIPVGGAEALLGLEERDDADGPLFSQADPLTTTIAAKNLTPVATQVARSKIARPGNALETSFAEDLLLIDNPERYASMEIVLEEEGFFSSEPVLKTPMFDLAHANVVTGHAATEWLLDAKSETRTATKMEFLLTKGSGMDPLATTILQSGRGESRAVVLDFKTVEDLPDVSSPLETTTADQQRIEFRILNSSGQVVEKVGPFATTTIGGYMKLRRADVHRCFRVPRVPISVRRSAALSGGASNSTGATGSTGFESFAVVKIQVTVASASASASAGQVIGATEMFEIDRNPVQRMLNLDRGGSLSIHTVLAADQIPPGRSGAGNMETTLMPGSLQATKIVSGMPGSGAAAMDKTILPGSGPVAAYARQQAREAAIVNTPAFLAKAEIDRAKALLLAASGQERALEKQLEAKQKVQPDPFKSGWRDWDSLDDLFGSLGPHPVTRSDMYDHLVVRAFRPEQTPLSNQTLEHRVHMRNVRVGLQVQRGVDWAYGDEDKKSSLDTTIMDAAVGAATSAAASAGINIPNRSSTSLQAQTPADLSATGMVTSVDEYNRRCSVVWRNDPGKVYSHYRIGRDGKYDLALVQTDMPPVPMVCQDLAKVKKDAEPEKRFAYVPFKDIVDPEHRDTLKYATYNREQDSRVSFWDAHPGYRIGDDVWAKVHKFHPEFRDHTLFVQSCVRQETVWA